MSHSLIFFVILLVLSYLSSFVTSECCSYQLMRGCVSGKSDFVIPACLDCSQPMGEGDPFWHLFSGWYCGVGNCNIFGCRCEGGCRRRQVIFTTNLKNQQEGKSTSKRHDSVKARMVNLPIVSNFSSFSTQHPFLADLESSNYTTIDDTFDSFIDTFNEVLFNELEPIEDTLEMERQFFKSKLGVLEIKSEADLEKARKLYNELIKNNSSFANYWMLETWHGVYGSQILWWALLCEYFI